MISKMTDHRLAGERSPELISSEFSLKLQAALKFGAWANWEFVNPVLHKKFSYQTPSAEENTDLEFAGRLQAFKKASSLIGLGTQAV